MQLFAPHLKRRLIDDAANAANQQEVDALFADIALPIR